LRPRGVVVDAAAAAAAAATSSSASPPSDARPPPRCVACGRALRALGAFSSTWSPYDRVGVVNADP
jgi:hypothetical protein